MTEASTTQFYNPVRGGWATELLEKFGLPTRILGRIEQPGTALGPLRPALAAETGLSAKVVLPGSHDTASAVDGRPGAQPARRAARLVLHQPGHLGLDGHRVAAAGGDRPGAATELHQRRRRGRHDPPAEEHHRPVAGAGVPPRVEPGRAESGAGKTSTGCRRRPSRWSRSSIPTPRSSWPRRTCPRPFASFCRRTGPGRARRRRGRAALCAWTASP